MVIKRKFRVPGFMRTSGVRFNPVVAAAAICASAFYILRIPLRDRDAFVSLFPMERITSVSGRVLSSPVPAYGGDRYSCLFRADSVRTGDGCASSSSGTVTLLFPARMIESFFPGKLYSVSAESAGFVCETGAEVTAEGQFRHGEFNVARVTSWKFPDSLSGRMNSVRAASRLRFRRLMYSWNGAGGLLLSLIAGSREYTEADTAMAFRNAGLSHILALSGMHLSLFSGIAVFLGRRAGRRFRLFMQIMLTLMFVWFAGLSPPLLRAFICSSVLFAAELSGSPKPRFLPVLCFSFLLQSVLSPRSVHDVSFVLSYGALAGITVFGDMFRRIFVRIFPPPVSGAVSSSVSAQILTAPVSLSVFGVFCPAGIAATSLVAPAVTLFIYCGLFCTAAGLVFPETAGISGIFLNFLYTVIKRSVMLFSRFPKIHLRSLI